MIDRGVGSSLQDFSRSTATSSSQHSPRSRVVAGKLGRFNEKYFQQSYQNRWDGPIACHVLVQNSRFQKMFLVEIGFGLAIISPTPPFPR